MSSSKSADMRQKADALQEQIEKISGDVEKKKKSFPIMMIIGAVIPFLVFAVLYFLQPGFVQKKEGSKYVRDTAKTVYWSLGITVLLWGVLFALNYFGLGSYLGA